MSDKVIFADLHRLLDRFGFKRIQVTGPPIAFEHEATGVLHAFRPHRPKEQVDPTTLAAVRMTLTESGFVTSEEFDGLIRDLAASTKLQARKN